MSDNPEANPEMVYSRPGGMTEHEKAKIRRNMGGGRAPNASGATQREREAPAILAGSEPSRELTPPAPTPEEIAAAAEHNKKRLNDMRNSLPPIDSLPPDPVNGEVDPLDQVHEAVLDDETDMEALRRMASAGEPLINIKDVPAEAPKGDELLD